MAEQKDVKTAAIGTQWDCTPRRLPKRKVKTKDASGKKGMISK